MREAVYEKCFEFALEEMEDYLGINESADRSA